MYHPDRRLEQLHRLTVAMDEARKARRVARRAAWREAFGVRLVSVGVKVGGRAAAVRVHDAGGLPNC